MVCNLLLKIIIKNYYLNCSMHPNSRQEIPQDSFYNDISQINPSPTIDLNIDLFAFNQRNPEGQNQEEIEPIISWASPQKTKKYNQEYASSKGIEPKIQKIIPSSQKPKPGKPPGKWVKSNEIFNKKLLLSLNFGEQNKIGKINQSLSTTNCSIILNTTLPVKHTNPIKSKIFTKPPMLKQSQPINSPLSSAISPQIIIYRPTQKQKGSDTKMELYKIEHESLIIIRRLRDMQIDNKMYEYEISSLRKYLIDIKNTTSKDNKLQYEFKPFVTEVQNVLQIFSFIQSSLQLLHQYEQTIDGILSNIVQSTTLMKLVKSISLKRVHKSLKKINKQFKKLLEEKSNIDKGKIGNYLQQNLLDNILRVKEILTEFKEEDLRENLSIKKEQILAILQSQTMTEIQKQVLLEIGCQLKN